MKNKISQAVILSAGLGTRLRSVTGEQLPKVMVLLAGKPLLEHHIEQFKKHGVREFFINLHYLPEKITSYFGDGLKWGVKIVYVHEPELRGTAGGVKNFAPPLNNHFFVVYGDMFSMVDYGRMQRHFFDNNVDAIGMMVVKDTERHDVDLAEVDHKLKLLKIHPKPHGKSPEGYKSLEATYILSKKILGHIPAQKHYMIDHDLLPALLARGDSFYGYQTDDYFEDVGTPERYKKVQEFIKRNKKPTSSTNAA